jgi:hypothetical protein
MSMTDLDAEIVALRVSGASERENCLRFGCTMGRVRAVLDTHAERVLAPENVLRVLIDGLGDLNAIERVFAPRAFCFWVYAYPAFLRYAAHSAGGY